MIFYKVEDTKEQKIKGYKSNFLQRLRIKVQQLLLISFSSLGDIPSLDDGDIAIWSFVSNSK